MTSTAVDRINGARSSLAIKAPCKTASIANLTLSGEQTVDGYAAVTGDRVLVKNQTSGINNGIYIVDTGTWERAPDADGNADWTRGTLIDVTDGATTSGFWYLSTTGTITVGTTALTFLSASVGLTIVSAFMQQVLAAADATTVFQLIAAAALATTGDITPTILAANTDNWAPTGFVTASTIRASSSAPINLTGIAAGTDGRLIMLHNIGAFAITLKDDATSTAANRFQMTGDYALNPDASVLLEYDATSSRWRLFGQQGTQASVSFNGLVNNVGAAITMAGNAVTIALKAADGTDPSSTNACTINMRDGSAVTSGKVNQRTVTAALSTAISSGSTGGTVSTQPSRIWIAAIDVGGTIELAWFNALSGTSIAPIDETGIISTTAEGGAGAADSAQTWYSTNARPNVAFTILGYFESTQAVAGTWAAAASVLAVNPPVRPGMKIQCQRTASGAVTGGATTIPNDDTIPQIGEGDLYLTRAITPRSSANVLHIEVQAVGSDNAICTAIMALFQDAGVNALTASQMFLDTVNVLRTITIDYRMVAGTIVSTSFTVRIGGSAAGTFTINGTGGGRLMGGVMNSQITVSEEVA